MSVNILNKPKNISKKILSDTAKAVFLFLKSDFEANIKFVTLDEIANFNKLYREKDCPTDVLSFKTEDDISGGDIVVCPAFAHNPENKWKMGDVEIIQLLVVHGLLHLAGFDHENPNERAKMELAEKAIMASLGIILE